MIINWSKDLDSVPLLEELCRGPGPPRMLWVEYHWMMLMAFICWCWYVYLIICCYVDMLMLIWWFADMLMLIYHICWYVDTLICWYAHVGAGDKFKPFLCWCQKCFWEESFHTHGTLSWEGDSWKLLRVSQVLNINFLEPPLNKTKNWQERQVESQNWVSGWRDISLIEMTMIIVHWTILSHLLSEHQDSWSAWQQIHP